MHLACPNKKQNHLQNSLLRWTQFWVRKTFSKPAWLKRASLVALLVAISHKVSLKPKLCASATLIQKTSKNESKHGPKNGTAWRSHFWDRMHSLVKEPKKKSIFTVPFLGPSGGTLFFLTGALCLSAGRGVLRLTRLPRHDRGPVPRGTRSAASCLCTVVRRALYHYSTRSPGPSGGTKNETAKSQNPQQRPTLATNKKL